MNWTFLSVFLGVLAVFLVLKRSGQISAKDARTHLKNGALVVDVRTPAEFNSGHLTGAINLPLDEIEAALPRLVKDKSQVLLLHCQSGMRSGVAKGKLKAMGYPNSYNIGSFARARKIVEDK
jgi:phage shock protein E